ncbi:glycosyltransferase [Salipiger sp. 1_MG-2023]|uniref:glycosyltransferase n=1 Tax=Salipiger sp. 1_MG-2023 TaxID=3062665 RepID=UPI0026E258F3|nr:glycosyltransferase [Salipiger sp. 1_MG-2023]MDO6586860.1 glycosyltransferase [Salipiger sp. 1_MG-2023]
MSNNGPELIDLVSNSPFFDADWYAGRYPDVALTGLPAAEHYMRVGWRIGRDPGPDFSTASYLQDHPDLRKQGLCPLVALARQQAAPHSVASDGLTVGPTPEQIKDIETVRACRLFDASWYLEQYPEAANHAFGPAAHYVMQGVADLLNPGPGFSTRFYLQKHPDIRKVGINPLVHYDKWGRLEGRNILPAILDCAASDPALAASQRPARTAPFADPERARDYLRRMLTTQISGEPVRMYQHFDIANAERFVAAAEMLAGETPDVLVSVIMPAYNRERQIGAAIESVLKQSWRNFELLVIDDGSTDSTAEVIRSYDDPRLRLLQGSRSGVSGARNAGLMEAKGEVIFYLDSDNTWTPDFIWLMMQAMQHSGARCGYGGTRLQSPREFLIGYRGEPYNWEACLALNYVDMNVFCHHRDFIDTHGIFDSGLKRMVDWDLILRYTRGEPVFYAPFIGCVYYEDGADMGRITTSQPIVSRKLVYDRNARNCDLHDAVVDLKYNIAIKMFAPWADRNAWGDYHYAESLAEALRRQGHQVRIDFRGGWYDHPVSADDVAIVLRGLEAYRPRPSQLNIFWGISHPDTVTPEEYDGYQGIFVASRSYAELLGPLLGREVGTLWQCTDRIRFTPPEPDSEGGGDPERGIFIGNSRREYRQIVKWAVEADLPLDVIGNDWETYLPADNVLAENAPNTELAGWYGKAAFVLNDHWHSMRDFGFVSNRVFDVLAAGGQLISDRLPSIEALFGDAVISVDSSETLRAAVEQGAMSRSREQRQELAAAVQDAHSFDRRATSLVNWIRSTLVPKAVLADELEAETPDRNAEPRVHWPRRPRVGVLAPWSAPESPAMTRTFERILAPLTVDAVATELQLIEIESAEDCAQGDLSAIIVCEAGDAPDAALLAAIEARLKEGLPVFLDTPQAQGSSGWAPLTTRLERVWSGDAAVAASWSQGETAPERLDPRIWRRYRNPRLIEAGPRGSLRLLAIVDPGKDAAELRTLVERLARHQPDGLQLQVVGLAPDDLPSLPWITATPWPEGCHSYGRRARWLIDNVEADCGFVTRADGAARLLQVMALGLVPAVLGSSAEGLMQQAGIRELAVSGQSAAGLVIALLTLLGTPDELLRRRRAAFELVWSAHHTLGTPDPRIQMLLPAAQSFETQV